jgi:hypothetical protein
LKEDYAADIKLVKDHENIYVIVPSSVGQHIDKYKVNMKTKGCTCIDYIQKGQMCKHYLAAVLWFCENFGTILETEITELQNKTTTKVTTENVRNYPLLNLC